MYQVWVKPKNIEAAKKLREKFEMLDDFFKFHHTIGADRIYKKENGELILSRRKLTKMEDHGLSLYDRCDEAIFVSVYAHDDYYHLKQTEKDLKKAMRSAFGSLEYYVIKRYW